ncbi:MAG TPA: SdiA-regulated domain-containing protein [Gemmatimonadales bacterium]|nr:SdiA-regulated domain-containing protein [Gemmatimonadales bacterium]
MTRILLALTALALTGAAVLDRFDFSHPAARVRLNPALAEASGLVALSDGRILTHTDELAAVYAVDPVGGDARPVFTYKGADAAGDWEDIAVSGDRAFLVRSDGALLEWNLRDGGAKPRLHASALGGRCEVEGLAEVPERRALLLLCKQHRVKDARGDVLGYFWSLPSGELDAARPFRVDAKALRGKKKGGGFSPSGVTRDPATGHLIMVAGPERRLAEVDLEGRVVGTATLDGKLHPQPEGIALAADGRLLIADEDARKGGTLTTYAPRANK